MKTRAFLTGLLLFVLLVLAFAIPLAAQVNVTNFDNVRSDGFIRADGYLRSGSYAQVGTFLRIDPATHITYTSGSLTLLGTNQTIGVATSRGITTITAMDAGVVAMLRNTSASATVTLTETTGNLILGGSTRALGPSDNIMLLSDGANWIEYSFTNN